jgi:hypothetical protein
VGHAGPGPATPDHSDPHADVWALHADARHTVFAVADGRHTIIAIADGESRQLAISRADGCHVDTGSVDAQRHFPTAL